MVDENFALSGNDYTSDWRSIASQATASKRPIRSIPDNISEEKQIEILDLNAFDLAISINLGFVLGMLQANVDSEDIIQKEDDSYINLQRVLYRRLQEGLIVLVSELKLIHDEGFDLKIPTPYRRSTQGIDSIHTNVRVNHFTEEDAAGYRFIKADHDFIAVSQDLQRCFAPFLYQVLEEIIISSNNDELRDSWEAFKISNEQFGLTGDALLVYRNQLLPLKIFLTTFFYNINQPKYWLDGERKLVEDNYSLVKFSGGIVVNNINNILSTIEWFEALDEE